MSDTERRGNADRTQQGGGGGPAAHRELLNQDGSRLDALGGPLLNPTGENPSTFEQGQFQRMPNTPQIGGEEAITEDEGQRRWEAVTISGGVNPSELGTPGWPQGDPSNMGLPDETMGYEIIEPESEE